MLLLDSQALLWMLDDSPRLGPQARQAITSAQGVHVSAATVWELTIKSMLGKLTVPHDLSKKLPGQGVELLRVTAEHTDASRSGQAAGPLELPQALVSSQLTSKVTKRADDGNRTRMTSLLGYGSWTS